MEPHRPPAAPQPNGATVSDSRKLVIGNPCRIGVELDSERAGEGAAGRRAQQGRQLVPGWRIGYNVLVLRPRSGGNVLVQFRYGPKREAIAQLLEARSIQYVDKNTHFAFSISIARAMQEAQMFVDIAKLNKRWWVETPDDNGS
jgi:hypothetical protein